MDDADTTTEAKALIARIRSGATDGADLDLAADLLERFTTNDGATLTYTVTKTEVAALAARSSEVLAEFRSSTVTDSLTAVRYRLS
jgi:hypothetical protein